MNYLLTYLKSIYFVFALALFLTLGSPLHAQDQSLVQVFILLAQSHRDATSLAQVQVMLEAGGGQVTHTFPHRAIIARIPADLLSQVATLPAVAALFDRAMEPATLASYGPEVRPLAELWNALNAPPPSAGKQPATAEHPNEPYDALIAPDLPSITELNSSSITPGYYQTSDYMAGSIAVGLILVESNGQIDPSTENWTEAEKQLVFNEIVMAMNWWAELEPKAGLSFVYDDHFSQPLPTAVEPILRPYPDQQYWIADAMSSLGYHDPSYFTQVRDYNNALRDAYQTDWAFTIFVVDSSNDPDNRFSDGFFAYAYLGGPFMVLTSGNNGYGPDNMDAVAAHETGHIFHALDQYYNAYQPCTQRSGYLYVENQNSLYGACASNTTSIMRGQTFPYSAKAIDPYAAGQIGWRDSDQDGIFDPLDTALPVALITSSQEEDQIIVRGQAGIVPYPSPHHPGITINTLTGVQYRLNGGAWQAATALDGRFDGTTEGYELLATLPAPGLYTLEVVAVDSAGNISAESAKATFSLFDPIDGGLNTELYPLGGTVAATTTPVIRGRAYHLQNIPIVRVEYRIDGGPWQPASPEDGAFDSGDEGFILAFDWGSLPLGPHLIEARAIDTGGKVETNVAAQTIEVIEQFTTWLPLIAG